MADLVIDLVEKGQVSAGAGKRILETHRHQIKKAKENP
jgi:polyhydroxyalkanoate synthesis regulator phasin